MMPANQVSPSSKLHINTGLSGCVFVDHTFLSVVFACFEHEMLSLGAAGLSGSADIYPSVVVLVFVL